MPLLKLTGLTAAFGGPPVLENVELVVRAGERLCLLGRNGCGKSTLLRVIAGAQEPDAGSVWRSGGLHIAFLEQQIPEDLEGRVLDVARSGLGCFPRRAIEDHVARAAVSRVGLDPDADVETLSVGLKRRALLAAALASGPDLLLLDEPTNHLDVEAIAWLEDFLRRRKEALLFVTHDRAFLRSVATGLLDLDRGHLSRFDADYDRYLDLKQNALEAEARADAVADMKLAREETWIRQGVRERRKRNQGRLRRLLEMREDRGARREEPGAVRMDTARAAPSGRLVLRAQNLSHAWDGAPIVRELTTTVMRGDRVGILGPNGSGKTTLLRLLLGELAPDAGEVRRGTNLEIGYFDQLHADLDPGATAADNVLDGGSTVTVNGRERHIIGYLGDFLFTPEQVRSPIRMFSGGERNRLLLARLFARPSNVLALDEPTNDLDVATLEVLEELLSEYAGTILMVSHDRELLDHVATSTLVIEGGGVVTEHVGGYASWFMQREKERAAAATADKGARGVTSRKSRSRPALTYAERLELQDLPARIDTLEAEQAARHERMSDPAFFRQDGARIAEARAELAEIEERLAAAYARWEALEEKGGG